MASQKCIAFLPVDDCISSEEKVWGSTVKETNVRVCIARQIMSGFHLSPPHPATRALDHSLPNISMET